MRQITSSPHPLTPVACYNSLATYSDFTRKLCTLGTSSCFVWLQRLYRFRQCQCPGHDVPVSAQVEVLTTAHQTFCSCMKYDLIRCKPKNKRSASAELTGRVQPIISKTRMLGYISSSANFTHSIRFPGTCKVGVYCVEKYYLSFNSDRREDGVGKSSCQNCSFSVKLRRLSCFTTADGTKENILDPALLSSLSLELISSNKCSIKGMQLNTIMQFRVYARCIVPMFLPPSDSWF